MSGARSIHYTAAGGVVVCGDQVLVLRRPSRGETRLPKGHVEPGETLAEAALREVREETGLVDLILKADLGTQVVAFDYEGRRVVRDEHYFLVELLSDAALRRGEDKFHPEWVTWDQAEDILTFEAEREWVRRGRRAQLPSADVQRRRVCLSTGSLYTYGLERVFEVASGAGFDGIELLVDHRWDTRHPAYARRLSETWHLPIVAVHSPFVPRVAGWPDDDLGRLRRSASLAAEIGVGIVVVHLPRACARASGHWLGDRAHHVSVPVPWPQGASYARFLQDELAEFEARERITVCVENMPATRLLGFRLNTFRYNNLRRLAGFAHLVLDTTHLATWGLDPAAAYTQLRERVAHVHLSSYDPVSGRGHGPPSHSDAPLAKLLRQLERDGYPGAIVLEANPDSLSAAEPVECVESLRVALAFCREAMQTTGE